MYMPYPFQIVHGTTNIQMAYTFTNAARVIHMDEGRGAARRYVHGAFGRPLGR